MDPIRVETCWKNIISQSNDLETLAHKVLILGENFYPSDWAFPLHYLCENLERVNRDWHDISDPKYSWVIQLMIRIGVSFETLFRIYDELLGKQMDNNAKLEILVPITCLVEYWINENKKTNDASKINIIEGVSNALQKYHSSLSSNDNATNNIKARLQYLLNQLKNMKVARNYQF